MGEKKNGEKRLEWAGAGQGSTVLLSLGVIVFNAKAIQCFASLLQCKRPGRLEQESRSPQGVAHSVSNMCS